MSSIKDAKLANVGHQEVDWAARQMKVLRRYKN
jgi:S-adenosylhomocysteine hydrolase